MSDGSTFSQEPNAQKFLQLAGTDTYLRARFGEPDTFPASEPNWSDRAHAAVRVNMDKVKRLAGDKTRTPPQKHDAARQLAEAACAALETAERGMLKRATEINQEGEAAILSRLDVDRINPKLFSLICDWFVRESGAEGGVTRMRARVEGDVEVAAVAFFSKGFLLNLPDATHSLLIETAYRKHVPDAVAKFERATQLRKWAENMEPMRRDIRASWFNRSIADQVSTRVEI